MGDESIVDLEEVNQKVNQLDQDLTTESYERSYDSKAGKYVYNKWTDANEKTVKSWKKAIERSTFIYEIILEKYKTKLNRTMVFTLIITSISTLVSTVCASIAANNGEQYIYVIFGLNVILAVLSAISTVLSGVIKINKWDKTVTVLSTFIEKLDEFYAGISSELQLHKKLRKNAVAFIQQYHIKYYALFRNSPDVNRSDYEMGDAKYTQYLGNNEKYPKHAHLFANDDVVIDII